jgi:Zn-finger nucleic acid-binding protein
MRCEALPSAQIDSCDACGGLWVDWFDGEVETLAVEAEAVRANRGVPSPPGSAAGSGSGSRSCPRCHQALSVELHRFHDAREDELVNGVELFRCPECAGSFVPRPSVRLLLDRVSEPPVVTLWEAFVALSQRLVGTQTR